MVNVDKAFELRYEKNKEKLEVLVDFDKLNEFKKNPEEISVYDVLADSKIFKDQKKGEIASANFIEKFFPNLSEELVLKEVLLNGECQIPTSYLNKLREEKKIQVINYIAQNSMNPSMRSKYTKTMIETEVNKLKYNFDPTKDFIFQAEEVLKLLKKVMPISLNKIILNISIPAEFSSFFYGPFRKHGKIIKEYFNKESNLILHMEISESELDTVENFIKQNSKGEASYYIMKK